MTVSLHILSLPLLHAIQELQKSRYRSHLLLSFFFFYYFIFIVITVLRCHCHCHCLSLLILPLHNTAYIYIIVIYTHIHIYRIYNTATPRGKALAESAAARKRFSRCCHNNNQQSIFSPIPAFLTPPSSRRAALPLLLCFFLYHQWGWILWCTRAWSSFLETRVGRKKVIDDDDITTMKMRENRYYTYWHYKKMYVTVTPCTPCTSHAAVPCTSRRRLYKKNAAMYQKCTSARRTLFNTRWRCTIILVTTIYNSYYYHTLYNITLINNNKGYRYYCYLLIIHIIISQ